MKQRVNLVTLGVADLERARRFYQRSMRPQPAETFWGGYSAVFVDPDGHPWEVAHNPHWTVAKDGGVELS